MTTVMNGIFRKFFSRNDKNKEKKKLYKSLEESTLCVIDVETLRCIVCLNIYHDVPLVLCCGHSFCKSCVEELKSGEFTNDSRDVNRCSFHCPMCRKRVSCSKIVQNYNLKTVLDSIGEISKEEEESRKAFDNNIDANNEQLRSKCMDLERNVDSLKRTISEMRHRETYNYVAISFFIIVYIVLSTFYGN